MPYQIRRVVWPQDIVISTYSNTKIDYPNYYIEDLDTGGVFTMDEYNLIKKAQVYEEFKDPYPDEAYMNNYYRDLREEIVDEFIDNLDYISKDQFIGTETVPKHRYKVIDGQLQVIEDMGYD